MAIKSELELECDRLRAALRRITDEADDDTPAWVVIVAQDALAPKGGK